MCIYMCIYIYIYRVRWGKTPPLRMNTLVRLRYVRKCKKYHCGTSDTIMYHFAVRMELLI